METYLIKIGNDYQMTIEEINICNNDEIENLDKDIIESSINNDHISDESEIKSFCSGNDHVEAYYSKMTANEEFLSFLNIDGAIKESEYVINLTKGL